MTTGVLEAEIHFVKYFHLMNFGSYLLQLGPPASLFCNILCIKKQKRTFHLGHLLLNSLLPFKITEIFSLLFFHLRKRKGN